MANKKRRFGKRLSETKLAGKFNKFMRKEKRKKYRRTLIFCICGGIILACLFTMKSLYSHYYQSSAHVSFVFPEISSGKYPDSTRFSPYDLIDTERVEEALEIFQEEGLYTQFTADEIAEQLDVYTYLENPVNATVNYMRTEGNDYSYYSSEYLVFYSQPFKFVPNMPRKGFGFAEQDYSSKFLETLMEVNMKYIKSNHTRVGSFYTLTDLKNMRAEELQGYDYSEKVAMYSSRLGYTIDYLQMFIDEASGFTSPTSGLSFIDVKNAFQTIQSEKLNTLSSFINASNLTTDIRQRKNKMQITIESNNLEFLKKSDEAEVNRYAQQNYDHTFTENLIIVSENEENGLYQARPKTAYDTVVQQRIAAENAKVEYDVAIKQDTVDLAKYEQVSTTTEEYKQLCERADELVEEFTDQYNSVLEEANLLVEEYVNYRTNSIFTDEIKHENALDIEFLIKFAASFVFGFILTFVIEVIAGINSFQRIERRREKNVKKVIREK